MKIVKEITDILKGYNFKTDLYKTDVEIIKAVEFISAYNNKSFIEQDLLIDGYTKALEILKDKIPYYINIEKETILQNKKIEKISIKMVNHLKNRRSILQNKIIKLINNEFREVKEIINNEAKQNRQYMDSLYYHQSLINAVDEVTTLRLSDTKESIYYKPKSLFV